ncbi:putative armadillo-like helical, importin beta family [Helianthus annuus]|nr:putative armadillo-like helical, importin beta family [Helianthus annuus]
MFKIFVVRVIRYLLNLLRHDLPALEIRAMTWPTLICSLLNNMTDNKRVSLKEATLEALGYVCQGISEDDHDLDQDEVEKVVDVAVNGMDAAENSPPVRLAATRALKNALALDEACYRAHETVSAVFAGATAETERADIRQATFECLGSVVSTRGANEPSRARARPGSSSSSINL